jgi:hypothetical protein
MRPASETSPAAAIAASVRLYRWLLRAYPVSFQAEYGLEMALAFRDACRAKCRQCGARGLLAHWLQTVPDLVASAIDQHAQETLRMAKTNLIRGLALAGLVGGALWIAYGVLQSMRPAGVLGGAPRDGGDLFTLFGVGALLLAALLAGLRMWRGAGWPAAARLFLLIGALGGAEIGVCMIAGIGWPWFVLGYYAIAFSLPVVGVTLYGQPEGRLWTVPLITAGVCLLLFNSEDWRALFAAGAGICVVLFSNLIFRNRLDHPSDLPLGPA